MPARDLSLAERELTDEITIGNNKELQLKSVSMKHEAEVL